MLIVASFMFLNIIFIVLAQKSLRESPNLKIFRGVVDSNRYFGIIGDIFVDNFLSIFPYE